MSNQATEGQAWLPSGLYLARTAFSVCSIEMGRGDGSIASMQTENSEGDGNGDSTITATAPDDCINDRAGRRRLWQHLAQVPTRQSSEGETVEVDK